MGNALKAGIFILVSFTWAFSAFFSILTMSKFKIKNMFVLIVPIANLFYFINECKGVKNKLNPIHYLIIGLTFWSLLIYNL
jgi:hypothetical protein